MPTLRHAVDPRGHRRDAASRPSHRPVRLLLAILALAAYLAGCAATPLSVRPLSQRLEVRLDPSDSTIEARSVSELEVVDDGREPGSRSAIELELHPDLSVTSVSVEGAELVRRRSSSIEWSGDEGVRPARIRLVVRDPAETLRVDVAYNGRLWTDVDAGEVEGQVHNFAVQAHVGEEGVYLEPEGYWYPRVRLAEGADPDSSLSEYELVTEAIEGFELVAGLERVPDDGSGGDHDDARADQVAGGGSQTGGGYVPTTTPDPDTGARARSHGKLTDGRDVPTANKQLHWRSPFPLDGLVLLGGPLERHTREHEGITLHAVVAPGKDAVAEDILAASAEYLDRYQPLIGPYPFREFTVLEAFFSSGFAFPTCTQIVGSQLSEYQQYRRHGYLDHELLHNWWGNGILVDPRDGNWAEGLASYMGNYAGHVLDGDEEGARKQRRNYSNFLSGLEADEDRPLGTFGLDGGAGRGIGYQKGAAVFHMLERKIGPDALLAGLRILTEERMGRHIGWDPIREAMERASGEDLDVFFEQWVRGSGAPRLKMTDAEWSPGASRVLVTLDQGETEFELDVPLRLYYREGRRDGGAEGGMGDRANSESEGRPDDRSDDRSDDPTDEPAGRWVDEVVTIDSARQQVEVPCETEGLTAIELDPDYHLFRKVDPRQTMPTSNLTRRSERLVIVLPEGEVTEPYRAVADSFRKAVLEEDGEEVPGHEVLERTAASLDPEELAEASVLVLGEAVRAPAIQELLGRTRSPVRWETSSFGIGENDYGAPGEAVFFTVHHPDLEELGVTVYYGNSERALSNARVLTYYPNSLLVFDTPPGTGDADASGMPRAEVVERIDLEFHDRIEF